MLGILATVMGILVFGGEDVDQGSSLGGLLGGATKACPPSEAAFLEGRIHWLSTRSELELLVLGHTAIAVVVCRDLVEPAQLDELYGAAASSASLDVAVAVVVCGGGAEEHTTEELELCTALLGADDDIAVADLSLLRVRVVGWTEELVRIEHASFAVATALVSSGTILRFARELVRPLVIELADDAELATFLQQAARVGDVAIVHASAKTIPVLKLVLHDVAAARALPRVRFASYIPPIGAEAEEAIVITDCQSETDALQCLKTSKDGNQGELPPCCQWQLLSDHEVHHSSAYVHQWVSGRLHPPAFSLTTNVYNTLRGLGTPLVVLYLDSSRLDAAVAAATIRQFTAVAKRLSFPPGCNSCWASGSADSADRCKEPCTRQLVFGWVSSRRGSQHHRPSLEVWHNAACARHVFSGDPTDVDVNSVPDQQNFLQAVLDGSEPPVHKCDTPWQLGSPLVEVNRKQHLRPRAAHLRSPTTALALPPLFSIRLPTTVDCLVIGAGPSGLGVAVALRAVGVHDIVVFEKGSTVGASFTQWYGGCT